jgi:hypothetical protein
MKLILILIALMNASSAADVPKWKSQLMAYEYCLLGKVIEGKSETLNHIEILKFYWGAKDCYLSQRLNIPKSKRIPIGSLVFVCLDVNPPKHGSARYSYIMVEDGPIIFRRKKLNDKELFKLGEARKEGKRVRK